MAAPAGTAAAPAATTAPHTPLHSAQPVPAAVHPLESVLHDVLSGGQVRSGNGRDPCRRTWAGADSYAVSPARARPATPCTMPACGTDHEDQWDTVPVKGQARAPGRCRDAGGTEPGRGLGMTAGQWSTSEPLFVEDVEGSARPAAYYLAESRDGLYVPYVVRTPADEGQFPFVFLAYGNGGGGIGWLREWVRSRPYIMERLLAARVTPAPGAGTARRSSSASTAGGPLVGRWPAGHGAHEPRRRSSSRMSSPSSSDVRRAPAGRCRAASAMSASAMRARCSSSSPSPTRGCCGRVSPASRPTMSSST